MTAYALVQGVLAARRDLRLKHELAVLDVSDAMTILVASPPHPERRTDGPWLGPDDNYADDNYADDNYADDIYPTTSTQERSRRSQRACHLVHDNHDPQTRAQHRRHLARQPSNGSPLTKEDPTTKLREDQEPYSTNRGRWGDVDVVDGRI